LYKTQCLTYGFLISIQRFDLVDAVLLFPPFTAIHDLTYSHSDLVTKGCDINDPEYVITTNNHIIFNPFIYLSLINIVYIKLVRLL